MVMGWWEAYVEMRMPIRRDHVDAWEEDGVEVGWVLIL